MEKVIINMEQNNEHQGDSEDPANNEACRNYKNCSKRLMIGLSILIAGIYFKILKIFPYYSNIESNI